MDFVEQLLQRVYELETAIRKHRDTRGDDRCYIDDAELYNLLPEGDTRPERDTAVTIENCKKFIECRQQGREYVSPERELERLRALVESNKEENAKQYFVGFCDRKKIGRLQAIEAIYQIADLKEETLPPGIHMWVETMRRNLEKE